MTAGPLAQPERQGYLNLTQHPQTGKSSKRRLVVVSFGTPLPGDSCCCLIFRASAIVTTP